MELRQLRYFVAIVEAGSLAKASKRLHVAQPALSVHLANIEAEVGVHLVSRNNRGIELTEEGQFLYDRAITTLQYHHESIRALKSRQTVPRGPVSFGILSTWADTIGAAVCRMARQELPDVSLYVVEASSAVLYEWLNDGRLDLAILFNLPEDIALETFPLFIEDYWLVSRPDSTPHPDVVEFQELFEYPLIVPCKSSVWRKQLDDAAEKCGKTFTPVLETESCSLARAIAISGEAHTILPRSGVREAIINGVLHARRVINPALHGLVSLASLQSTGLGKAQSAVRDAIIRIARNLGNGYEYTQLSESATSGVRAVPGHFLPSRRRHG